MRQLAGWGRRHHFGVALMASALLFAAVTLAAPRTAAPSTLRGGAAGTLMPEWIGSRPVWVVTHDDGRTTVLDAVNPHRWYGLKELVGWCAGTRYFTSYYDGSRFGLDGSYLFGPAPHSLNRWEVAGRDGDTIHVGRFLTSASRASSGHHSYGDGAECWIDPGGPVKKPPHMADAAFHTRFPRGYALLEGAVLVSGRRVVFCERVLAGGRRCRDEPIPVVAAVAQGTDDGVAVTRGRFLARRTPRGLVDVTVLPGGYYRWLTTNTAGVEVAVGQR